MSHCDICYRDVDDGVACKECGGLDDALAEAKHLREALRTLLAFVEHELKMGRLVPLHRCESLPCNCAIDEARRTLEANP